MSKAGPIISTWLVADSVESQSEFPQVPGRSSSLAFQSVYWRCVVCFFATLARVSAPGRRLLFTNVDDLPTVDGVSIQSMMERLGVEVRYLPIAHRLKHPSVRTWGNQFYILDIIREADLKLDFSSLLVLDADCIWMRSIDELLTDLARYGILTLELAHRDQYLINGVTRLDMKKVAEALTEAPLDHVPHYVGGEMFACTREMVASVRQYADTLWAIAERPMPNGPLLREEGHLLSVVYDLMKIAPGTADAHIKRMWTTFRFHNVTDEDLESSRCIWHLPAEKNSGFVELFYEVVRPGSRFWTVSDANLPSHLAQIMGVPRRGPKKWVRDVIAKISEKTAIVVRGAITSRIGDKRRG